MKKEILFGLVAVLALFAIGGTVFVQAGSTPKIVVVSTLQAFPANLQPVTMIEAWNILVKNSKIRDDQIMTLNSANAANDPANAGSDGKRRVWEATLWSSAYPTSEFLVTIQDGSIASEVQQPRNPAYVQLSKPQLDSPRILKIALASKKNFTPDNNKNIGYQYSLEYSKAGNMDIVVQGAYQKIPARITIDASSGNLVGAEYRGFDGGGILYSNDSGKTWQASNLTGMILKVVADPDVKNHAYAVGTKDQKIVVYETRDGGKDWSLSSELPASAGYWPYDIALAKDSVGQDLLFVGADSDVWEQANGKNWGTLSGLPAGPKQWLGTVKADNGYRLFVSITAGSHQGLYATDNLSQWNQISKVPLRLSPSYDKKLILATNDAMAGQAWLLSKTESIAYPQAEPFLRSAGDFKGKFVSQSTIQGVGRANAIGKIDTANLSFAIDSLAAAPDFPSSNLLLAGGFRSGIFVSTDGGQNWKVVLDDPAKVIQGNDEIYSIEFLSPTTIIAVNGGNLTWTPF